MNVQEKINYMENKRGRNHELVEFRSWLDAAFPTHSRLHKIQVGGTNGKGSTVTWMKLMLEKMGYKVGVFTSPHLVSHMERICINDQMISLEDWERIYDQYSELFEAKEMTMFEIDVWMSLAYFLEQQVDIALFEVGMGGRLDATTALDYDITLITNVGFDHEAYLGDSLEQITFEKSGIFKPGVMALTTEENPKSQKVMEQVAGFLSEEYNAFIPLGFVEMPYKEKGDDLEFVFQDETYVFTLPKYQFKNMALALEALTQLGYPLNKDIIQYALDYFRWAGRFMTLQEDPWIIVDGAHNVEGIKALVQSLPEFKGQIYFSVLSDKHAQEMIEILQTLNCPITLVSMDSYRLYPLEELNLPIIDETELKEKLEHTTEDCLLCGSLYFVGDVVSFFQKD